MTQNLVRYSNVLEIVGDILKIRVPRTAKTTTAVCFGDLALVENVTGERSLAQVINVIREDVSLQVFTGTKGLSTGCSVSFPGHPMRATYSPNILGRVFRGAGEPMDGGPDLAQDPQVPIGGPSVNPMRRVLASKMIRTDVPMIDVFNCLVESQKIPIFSVAGEPFNPFLARIGIQADADVVVFGGMGLIFDDYYFFRKAFEDAGVFARTIMYVNLASDPIVERTLVPDMALAVAEKFAVEEGKRVLVLLTDMTGFADALKELGIAMERVPSNRGYMGDLYSQLARRYEKACDYKGAGSVTILTATTMPGNDVTHPGAGQHRLHHRGPVLPAQRHARPVRLALAPQAARDRQGDAGGPRPGDEHHDSLLFGRAGRRAEAGHGVRPLRLRPSAVEVRRPFPRAVHGHRGRDAARRGFGSLLADHGGVLCARTTADAAELDRQIFSETSDARKRVVGHGPFVAQQILAQS